jgi:hypothetical protein
MRFDIINPLAGIEHCDSDIELALYEGELEKEVAFGSGFIGPGIMYRIEQLMPGAEKHGAIITISNTMTGVYVAHAVVWRNSLCCQIATRYLHRTADDAACPFLMPAKLPDPGAMVVYLPGAMPPNTEMWLRGIVSAWFKNAGTLKMAVMSMS